MLLQDAEAEAEAATAYWIGIMIFWTIFWIVWIVIAILMCIWVYKDAKEREDVDETLWLIIVILTGIIGFLIYYFVVRKEK
jgi:hypothetical protein